MSKYRKKPVVIDAEPYEVGLEDGFESEDKMIDEIDIKTLYKHVEVKLLALVALYPFIKTLEGRHFIGYDDKGDIDMIITGVDGERYPCKNSIFKKTYEDV